MTTTAPSASATGEHIDENLYSRQLYVLGHEAMRRMQTSNVLIVGLNGLGAEVAKNVILTGVKSVTLYDPKPVSMMDLSSQFYLTEAHIGKNRVECSLNHLKELNPYVPVKELTGDLTENVLASFNVVVFTDHNIAQLVNYNEIARKYGVKFIAGEIRGLFGAVFVDCGNGFEIFDVDGENTVSNIVTNITNENPALVNVHDDKKTHGLYDGDLVAFEDVDGMPEVNEAGPFEIKSTGKHTFTINVDATKFGKYKSGGFVKQLKKKKVMDFLPLKEALKAPLMLETDFAKLQRPAELHACFRALGDFLTQKGRLPGPYNAEDANIFVELAKAYHDQIEVGVAQKFAYTAAGNLNPIAAFIGGIVAQEVQKACSGKFHPINQFLYFDSLEALPEQLPTEADATPINSRYDGQIVVFGNEFQKKLMNKKAFIVGSGALGCEYLKNFAVMGLGCGPEGKVYVTDMDSIEISNLNRQFLFRKHHVGQLKSVVAAAVSKEMNPSFNVVALSDKVAPQTEEIFDDEFWGSLDVIVNALDNVQARLYVDSRCVYYRKPLIEAGTLGTKGNVQVVIPFLTESYGSSPDPPEQEIPICTLKNFPNAIEHTIQWARDLFEGFFKQAAEDVNAYLSKPDFLKELESQGANKRSTLESIFENLVTSKPLSFDECIIWARLKFDQFFNSSIQQLLYNFPIDMITASGTPFWGGPKRPPTPLKFHATDKTHLGFIIAAANLRAEMYGLKGPGENYDYQGVLASVHVPQFTPKTAKIATTEAEAKNIEVGAEDEQVCNEIVSKLPSSSSLAGFRMNTINFEKDDDTNFHMDFITAASNLRARNYKIKEADKHQTKGIAGKIIPAMVTTTALITGLGAAELIKYVIGKTKVEDFKNSFVNIAIPFVTLSEPVQPAKKQMKEKSWTLWDRLEINVGRDMTLKEFMEEFEKKFGFSISMMSSGQAVIYSFFGNKKKLQERMVMPLSVAVQEVSKIEFGPKQKYINFEVCCNDEEGEDVDVPYVRYQFRNFN